MTKIVRLIALPVLSAGVIGGAALGLAGAAGATTTTTPQGPGHSFSPDTRAHIGPSATSSHQGHNSPDRAAFLLNR
jgi:ABC-type enterobactin transport system permease subunit